MIQMLVKEMCNTSIQGWKSTFINFKIVNAKTLKMELKKTAKT